MFKPYKLQNINYINTYLSAKRRKWRQEKHRATREFDYGSGEAEIDENLDILLQAGQSKPQRERKFEKSDSLKIKQVEQLRPSR